jgi:hypothetical protein
MYIKKSEYLTNLYSALRAEINYVKSSSLETILQNDELVKPFSCHILVHKSSLFSCRKQIKIS